MSELISGKEALIALVNGEEVEYKEDGCSDWNYDIENLVLSWIKHDHYQFRIKPRTITLNSIEVPAPFEPKGGEWFYFIAADSEYGYSSRKLHDDTHEYLTQIGAWHTEDEIKQVVAALREVFNVK